jgi:hypothetical protein
MAQVCSNCGSRAQTGDRFCDECGTTLEHIDNSAPGPAAPKISKDGKIDRSGLLWLGAGLGALVLGAVALLYWTPATVPPKPQRQPHVDEMLRARLVGKVYEGGLDIQGWEDFGGGLIIEPIWYSQYQHKDGTSLVLANVAQPLRPGAMQTRFRIADILLIPALPKGQEISYFCRVSGQGTTRAIVAVIQPDYDNEVEWWKDVRQAWTISLTSGQVTSIDPKGLECVNEGWGL